MNSGWQPLEHLSITDDASYEWLLSDHPWAAAGRARRRLDSHQRRLAQADEAQTVADRLEHSDDLRMQRLGRSLLPLAQRAGIAADIDDSEPDDLYVSRLRRSYAAYRRTRGDDDYEYPADLIGDAATAHDPPLLE